MTDKNYQERCSRKLRFWQVHVRAWEKSGLSQNEYCRRNRLSSSQLAYWKKKIVQQEKVSASFVPVPVQGIKAPTGFGSCDSGLTIFLDNDLRIRLNNGFNPAALNKAVAALRSQS